MQPYFNPTRKNMEYGRQPYFLSEWKSALFFSTEDYRIFFVNGRQPSKRLKIMQHKTIKIEAMVVAPLCVTLYILVLPHSMQRGHFNMYKFII